MLRESNVTVSIIIPVLNQKNYTKLCLDSIAQNTQYVKTAYEVIVVDNASDKETKEYLEAEHKAGKIDKLIRNEVNAGFPKAINQGAAVATGEFICISNNDIVVSKDWLEIMLRTIKSDTSLAAVAPYTCASSGYQKVTNAPKFTTIDALNDSLKAFKAEEEYVDFLVFFCCLITKYAWEKLNGLDEAFSPACFEDNYFCHQAIKMGFKLKISNCYIHHFGSTTIKTMKDDGYVKLLARNQRIFMEKIGRPIKVGLSMIVADSERISDFKRCIDSAKLWVDSINIVFNYKHFPNPFRLKQFLKATHDKENTLIGYTYEKWTNFSDMRNKSIDMTIDENFLSGNEEQILTHNRDGLPIRLKPVLDRGKTNVDYILWLDCDDVLDTGIGIKDIIYRNPDIDAFRCEVHSMAESGGWEVIDQPRLFKNRKEIRFRNSIHEDIMLAIKEHGLKHTTTNIQIRHLGYTDAKTIIAKNRRNIAFLEQEIAEGKDQSLTYYHLVNSYMVIGHRTNSRELKKTCLKCVKLIDKCLDKFKMPETDPLLPKMWVLRGIACENAGQDLAAKQSHHKAWDEHLHPEAGINLAELYMKEKRNDKAKEICLKIYDMGMKKELKYGSNMARNIKEIQCLTFEKLGNIYFEEKNWEEAQKFYMLYLQLNKNLPVMDKLCQVLRTKGMMREANLLTVQIVNTWPNFAEGWYNLSMTETMNKRFVTAKLFLEQALKIKPKYPEARFNLNSINKMMKGKL